MKKVLLIGNGFLGKNFSKHLSDKYDLIAVNSKDYNLLDFNQAEKMFRDIQPEITINCAGKSGGILSNKTYPADFWYENMMLVTNIWDTARKYTKKLIHIMPGCAYSAKAPAPIKEEDLFDGFPDLAPAAGALSKRQSILASYAYRKQHGFNSCILIPANAFGEHDHFDENNSHVVPSLLLKMRKAKNAGAKTVELWGTGAPLRDLIYAEDVAKCIPYFIENDINFKCDNSCLENVCNISTGKGTSIKELAETIADVVGFDGEIKWNHNMPNGPMDKRFSNERMTSLGLVCPTTLKEGLQKTYKWFLEQQ